MQGVSTREWMPLNRFSGVGPECILWIHKAYSIYTASRVKCFTYHSFVPDFGFFSLSCRMWCGDRRNVKSNIATVALASFLFRGALDRIEGHPKTIIEESSSIETTSSAMNEPDPCLPLILPPRYRLRDLILGDYAFNDDGERWVNFSVIYTSCKGRNFITSPVDIMRLSLWEHNNARLVIVNNCGDKE